MKMHTLASVARKVSKTQKGRFVTEDRIWQWVNQGLLKVEKVPNHVHDWGTRPYWAAEDDVRNLLQAKGFDVDSIFPKTEQENGE